jgi:hypothetical protein
VGGLIYKEGLSLEGKKRKEKKNKTTTCMEASFRYLIRLIRNVPYDT